MSIGVIGAYNKTNYYYKKAQNKNLDNFYSNTSKDVQEQAVCINDKPSADKFFNMTYPYISYVSEDNDVEAVENDDLDEFIDYAALIHEKVEQMREQLKNGEVEPKFQIGALLLSEKQWDKLMAKIDLILEQIHEEIEEETKKIREEAAEKKVNEAAEQRKILLGLLSGEAVRYEHISENGKEFYITCYTKDGIYCKAPNQNGFLWHIKLEEGQYEKIIEFINRFDKRANLSFAPNQSFWRDFLSGKIDENDFEINYKNAYNGLPDGIKTYSYFGYGKIDKYDVNIGIIDKLDLIVKSEYFPEYFTEFADSFNRHMSSDENAENLSLKYKELYENTNEMSLNEDERNDRIKVLNNTFKIMLNILSNKVI